MTDVTIKTLAAERQTSVERLVQQFADAGIRKSADDSVSAQEKQTLIDHLNQKNSGPDKLTLQRKTRSTLNIPGTGGKSKSVQIEVRKKRTFVKRDPQEAERLAAEEQAQREAEEQARREAEESAKREAQQKAEREAAEQAKREAAEQAKREAAEKDKVSNQQDDMTKNAQAEKARREQEAAELKRKAEEEARRKLEEEARRVAEEARRMAEENKWTDNAEPTEDSSDYHVTTSQHARQAEDESDREVEGGRGRGRNAKAARPKKGNKHAESKADREEARAAVRGGKGGKRKGSSLQQGFQKPAQAVNRDVVIGETITVGELANKMAVKGSQVIKAMMKLGAMATINQVIDQETAQLVAEEMGHKVILRRENELEEAVMSDRDTGAAAEPRAPVVTIMGHVDHGKTSILDAIRKTNVTAGEAGGITQHIGAYQVVADGRVITFLDTPGHEAFTSMRARGANLTDIAVLVVAADDGIMPQTVESINHAKAAGVSIIVAINKMDKPTANPERVKEQLTQYELVPEEWGGDVICVPVSAMTGMGIDDLLENINLVAEVKELKANPNCRARGAVVEARLDKGQGPIATLLVQRGTLHKGDVIIAGTSVGRVRTMKNDKGQSIETAGPSTPVEITGLTEVPVAGDLFDAVEDERLARELADKRAAEAKEKQFNSYQKVTLDNLFSQIAEGERKQLDIIVKADVQGSAEAVKQSLEKISNDEVRVKVIHAGVGAINTSDVMLADASNAIIIGFNVRPDPIAKEEAAKAEVEMRMYRVIYDAINDVTDAMKGMLAPKIREVEQGRLEVRQVYKISSVGQVAGCYVTEGKVTRASKIRVVRDGIVMAEDEISSLRRFKDDVKDVAQGYECGVTLEKFADVKEGDVFEAYVLEEYRD